MEATCSLRTNKLSLFCPAASFRDANPLHRPLDISPATPIASHCDASHCASAPDTLI